MIINLKIDKDDEENNSDNNNRSENEKEITSTNIYDIKIEEYTQTIQENEKIKKISEKYIKLLENEKIFYLKINLKIKTKKLKFIYYLQY